MRTRALLVVLMLLPAPAAARASGFEPVPPVRGPITRHFEAPPDPYGPGHRGLDLAVPEGTLVAAAEAGVVAFAGQVGGRLFVSIDHVDGLRTTYSFLDAVLVRAGQWVAREDVVARSGAGHDGVDPAHLHFGLRRGDEYLDPEPFLLAGMRRNVWRVVRLVPVD